MTNCHDPNEEAEANTRAIELDPNALKQESRTGVVAQISSPEERPWVFIHGGEDRHAKRGDVDGCLQCLRKAKEECYRDLATSIKTQILGRSGRSRNCMRS